MASDPESSRRRSAGRDLERGEQAATAVVAQFAKDNPHFDAALTLGPPGAEAVIAAFDSLPERRCDHLTSNSHGRTGRPRKSRRTK